MTLNLSSDQTRALRLRAQRLILQQKGGQGSVSQVLKSVCGVQAQEAPAAALAVRVRSRGFQATDVEDARVRDRTVIRTWCQRGTLHLLAVEDYGWLLPLLGPISAAGSRSRHLELRLDEDIFTKGIRLLERALADQGPLTRESIAGLFAEHGLPSQGQAPIHLIHRAALQGVLCQGPDLDGKAAFVLVEDWLGKGYPPGERLSEEEAYSRLARRYLEAYSPATPQDLAAWSGIPAVEARRAWKRIESDLLQVEIPNGTAWMLQQQTAWLEENVDSPLVRLLPRFDTYLLGYSSRDLAISPEHARRLHPGGGILRAALLIDGRVEGIWSLNRRRDTLEVKVEPFVKLPDNILPGLEAEAADLKRFYAVNHHRVLIV